MDTSAWIEYNLKIGGKKGNEISIHCPLIQHGGDQTPSASINVTKKVFNCLKCGGMHLVDLAKELKVDPPDDIFNKSNGTGVITSKYQYRDEAGKVLYEVHRYTKQNGEKTFLAYNPLISEQERKERKEKGIKECDGVRRVIFRLPEIISAIKEGKSIFIAEGEKDVNNLVKRGFEATTNAFGSSQKKQWEQFSSFFPKDTKIFICPDADKPGKDYANTVFAYLKSSGCKVKILDFGYKVEPKGGKDISDWFGEGHTVDDLKMLCVMNENAIKTVTLESERTADIPPRIWFLDGMVTAFSL